MKIRLVDGFLDIPLEVDGSGDRVGLGVGITRGWIEVEVDDVED